MESFAEWFDRVIGGYQTIAGSSNIPPGYYLDPITGELRPTVGTYAGPLILLVVALVLLWLMAKR